MTSSMSHSPRPLNPTVRARSRSLSRRSGTAVRLALLLAQVAFGFAPAGCSKSNAGGAAAGGGETASGESVAGKWECVFNWKNGRRTGDGTETLKLVEQDGGKLVGTSIGLTNKSRYTATWTGQRTKDKLTLVQNISGDEVWSDLVLDRGGQLLSGDYGEVTKQGRGKPLGLYTCTR